MNESQYTPTSGYTHCACRDCFELAISSDDRKPEFCAECEIAGCEPDSECAREDAYCAEDCE